jgi:translation initiation factor IF-3
LFFPNKAQQNHKVRANEQIRVPQIRLIGSNGEQIGIVPTKDALRRAQEEGYDLVEVAPLAKPPVCRILDLSKYLYSLEKKEKESRKKQKIIKVKEVKLTSKIEEHDYQTKLRNARKFIEGGDKVKLTMFFRGREITHADIGRRIIQRFIEDLSDAAEVERNDGLEGNAIHLYFTPKVVAPKVAVPAASPSPKKPAESGSPVEKGKENAENKNE